ncbi:single-stranded DNA-binding protein [Sulfobacillus harzensis]|uniref:Single-stranded DNA-binding protein n=1 Tax=Sulfobacillus harzensis TaxID=2729629 RepID=A0A7Y0Q5P1_9FIRM|nr:single-stranded DNA-binding protein [Sulfobacillus harzensis]NMP24514.1 single-stranded DNA-binding protein [Sulfobacillus harzensis]
MMNVIILEGRLVADPELRYTPQGVPVAHFRMAVDRPFVGQDGNKETDFFQLVAWRKLGETVANNLTKGRLVSVRGRLQMRQYEAQDGSKRTVYEINCDEVNFLDRRPEGAGAPGDAGASTQTEELPDDLPF